MQEPTEKSLYEEIKNNYKETLIILKELKKEEEKPLPSIYQNEE